MTANKPLWALSELDSSTSSPLLDRLYEWPQWSIKPSFKRLRTREDLFYPKWFEGNWEVSSLDLDDPRKRQVRHLAHFKIDSSSRVIGDRAFNSQSLGKELFGEDLIEVKDQPGSFNRQLTIFKGNKFLETKIISREQEMINPDLFLADEVSLQIFHDPELSRISQVETLSLYKKCEVNQPLSESYPHPLICGDQWQVIYPAPGDFLNSSVTKSRHYRLTFNRFRN